MAKPFRFTFCKEERLCSQKLISELYTNSNTLSHFKYPLRTVWLFTDVPGNFPAQVVLPVPKKNFKKAHERNGIRRLMRESYRLQKNFLYAELLEKNASCIIAISYIAKEKHTYKEIFDATNDILRKIGKSAPKSGDIPAIATAEIL